MRYCLITFRSVTPAQRAEMLLKKAGIKSSVKRTPRWMEEQGCGYSLQVMHSDLANSIRILKSNQVAYKKIYVQFPDGKIEELAL